MENLVGWSVRLSGGHQVNPLWNPIEAFTVGLNCVPSCIILMCHGFWWGWPSKHWGGLSAIPQCFGDQTLAHRREGMKWDRHRGCGRGDREAGCLQRQSCQGWQVVRDASSFMSHEIKLISPAIYCHAVPSILWELPGVSWQNVILFFFPERFRFDSLSFNGSVKSPLSILWYLDGRH